MRVLSSGHSEGYLSCDAQAVCDIDTYIHMYICTYVRRSCDVFVYACYVYE